MLSAVSTYVSHGLLQISHARTPEAYAPLLTHCSLAWSTVNRFSLRTIVTEHKHFHHTRPAVLSYLWIRRAVGSLGLALPIILGPIGWLLFSVDIQENMSSYYHTPLRDVFVGVMCAIGLFLFCYVGSTQFENWTGNLGCLAAVGVALCPIDANSDPLYQATVAGYAHTVFGGLFFLTLALFSIYHFPHNEPEEESNGRDFGRRTLFRLSGAVLLMSVVAMGMFLFVLSQEARETLSEWNVVFWGEWIAVWAFAIAWLIKGRTFALFVEGLEVVKALRK